MAILALTADNTLSAVVTGAGAAAAAAGAAIAASSTHVATPLTGEGLLGCIALLCLLLAAVIGVLTIGCCIVEGVSEFCYKFKVWRDCRRIKLHSEQRRKAASK